MAERIVKRNILAVLVAAALLMSLCSGCTLRPRAARTDDGKKLFRLGFADKGGTLNPYGAYTDAGALALSLLYDTLFVADPATGGYAKSLCADYRVTDNDYGARRWEITIRPDAHWSDGEIITAADVEFSFQSQSLFSSLYSAEVEQLLDTVGIAVTGYTSLVIIAWGTDEEVLSLLSRLPILPKHIWNEPDYMQFATPGLPHDAATAAEELAALPPTPENMVSSGMYTLESADAAAWHFRYQKKAEAEDVDAAAVDFVFDLGDPAGALTDGTVDGVYNGFSLTLQYWREHGGYYTESASPCQILLEINQFPESVKALRSADVRRAISLALPREKILTIGFDGGTATDSFLVPSAGETAPAADVDSAAALMKKAGYTAERPLELELLYSTEDPSWGYAAEEIRAALAEIGVDVTLTGAAGREMARRRDTRTYELLLTGRVISADERLALLPYYWSGGRNAYTREDSKGHMIYAGWNECGYASERFDTLYTELSSSRRSTGQRENAELLENMLREDAAGAVIGYLSLYQACSATWLHGTAEPQTGAYYSVNNLRSFLRQIRAG